MSHGESCENIDRLLRGWPYEADGVLARMAEGEDGRQVVQMRIEMGLLQMEVAGRPDGTQPKGFRTYLDYIQAKVRDHPQFRLRPRDCAEIDRELVQFYHRRICWLALQNYPLAARDADHTLTLMDFCAAHGTDPDWIESHAQYRPFVLFHRTQAAALAAVDRDQPERALEEVATGLRRLQAVLAENSAQQPPEENELLIRLHDLQVQLRQYFDIGPTLAEQLAEAVATEQYERAAQLRDEIERRQQADN